MAVKGLTNLCTPSYLYLVVSLFLLFIVIVQSWDTPNQLCVGSYSCNVSSMALLVILKLVYILFWTWILNLICDAGAPGIAWFIFLIPFILFFLLVVLLMLS
jgi:hypothetical protein